MPLKLNSHLEELKWTSSFHSNFSFDCLKHVTFLVFFFFFFVVIISHCRTQCAHENLVLKHKNVTVFQKHDFHQPFIYFFLWAQCFCATPHSVISWTCPNALKMPTNNLKSSIVKSFKSREGTITIQLFILQISTVLWEAPTWWFNVFVQCATHWHKWTIHKPMTKTDHLRSCIILVEVESAWGQGIMN